MRLLFLFRYLSFDVIVIIIFALFIFLTHCDDIPIRVDVDLFSFVFRGF